MQLPRNFDFNPPLSASQKSLTGVQARMKAMVDAVPNARTKTPQARTIRRKGRTGKMRYWNRTLVRREYKRQGRLAVCGIMAIDAYTEILREVMAREYSIWKA